MKYLCIPFLLILQALPQILSPLWSLVWSPFLPPAPLFQKSCFAPVIPCGILKVLYYRPWCYILIIRLHTQLSYHMSSSRKWVFFFSRFLIIFALVCVKSTWLKPWFFFNWNMVDTQHHISFRCATWSFNKSVRYAALAPSVAAVTVSVPLTVCRVPYLSSPWLTPSITGSLCLPLPFTHFAHPPSLSPLTTRRSLFSAFVALFLLLFVTFWMPQRSKILW